MKLSFSLSSKPSSKPPQQNHKPPTSSQTTFNTTQDQPDPNLSSSSTKQYVTEFDSSKTPNNPDPNRTPVIPPKPNEWNPYKKLKNLPHLLSHSDPSALAFELDPTPSSSHPTTDSSSISFGLNLRQSVNKDSGSDREMQPRPESIETIMLKKLKDDLQRLPEDNGFDEFTDMPVENFAKALLGGYGWVEGRGVGRNAREDVKVVEYTRRTAKEGLGFTGEILSENPKQEREKLGRDERKEDKGSGFYVGKEVRVVGGRDIGLKGRIVKVTGKGDLVILKLSDSDEEVTTRVCDIADLGSEEDEKCLRKLKELRIRVSKGRISKDKDGGNKDKKRESKRGREERKRGCDDKENDNGARDRVVSWLTSHIRVRIISKEIKGGRLYLKKGVVLDVVGPTTCDISMDDSMELVQGVDQRLLETAIPRRGGPVLVLCGRHKGVYGSLVERDIEKETGVVRDADSHKLLNVRLEDIAEYIGDPSYVGY